MIECVKSLLRQRCKAMHWRAAEVGLGKKNLNPKQQNTKPLMSSWNTFERPLLQLLGGKLCDILDPRTLVLESLLTRKQLLLKFRNSIF